MKELFIVLKEAISILQFNSLTGDVNSVGVHVSALLCNENLPINSEAMYITDDPDIALYLRQKGMAVLAYNHGDAGIHFKNIQYLIEDVNGIDFEYVNRIFQRYKNIPWKILETDRCIVRESTVEDVDAFYEIYKDKSITEYTEDLYEDRQQEIAYMQDYIAKMYRFYEFGVWTITDKNTGEIMGRAGISMREGYDIPELGFVIGQKFQGQGVATEVCRAILEYGREYLGFKEFQALVMEKNKASIHLLDKLGFVTKDMVHEKGQEYLLMRLTLNM